MKLFFNFLILIFVVSKTYSTNFPFPHNVNYPYGIKPTNYTQQQMNNFVQQAFNHWRQTYLTSNGCPAANMKRIQAGSAQNYETYSEGIGYGLLILVLMDNSTNNTRADFDAVFRYYKHYNDGRNLMHWRIDASGNVTGQNAATDGDEDVALALLFADKQWGSNGSINYLQEARTIINALKTHCVEAGTYVLKPGDAFGGSHQTNPSYYAPSWYKLFYQVTNDSTWLQVINRCYSTINYFYTTYNTALVANWCKADGTRMDSQYRWWNNDYDYTYDACRVPWRIGLDYLWYGTQHWSNTKNFLLKLSNWIRTKTNSNPSAIVDGYDLQGNTIGQYNNAAFVGPFAVGAMCDSSLQQWLNSLFERLVNFSVGGAWGYYQDHLRLLTMLVLTGNFPNLLEMSSSQPTTYTLTVNVSPQGAGSVTLNPSGGVYQSGTQVILSASANSGWQFNSWSGAITTTQNPTTIVMDSNKTVTANFRDIQPPQVSITNPTNNATVSGAVEIRAQATDNAGVSKVLFYINNVCVSTDTTSPYTYNWHTTNYSNGQYIIKVEAYDTSGNSSYAQVTVSVSNTGNVVISTYIVNINIQPQGAGIVDLNPSGGIYQAGTTVTLTAIANSGYTFSHWSGDLSGNQVVATILVNSNKNITANFSTQQQTEIPTLVINNPVNNATVSGIVVISVEANSSYGIRKVEFYIDGNLVFTDLDYPYVFNWDTTYYPGTHTIYIVAFDNQNNYATNSITVNVSSVNGQTTQEKYIYVVSLNNKEKVYFDKEYDFTIFDTKGKIIRKTKSMFWDCKDEQGRSVPIGVYIFKLYEDFNNKKFGNIIVLK